METAEAPQQSSSEVVVPTLYIRNLNDKIKPDGKLSYFWMPVEMKICLFHLFSTYGEVIQVRTRQTQQMRGQAFVVYRDHLSA